MRVFVAGADINVLDVRLTKDATEAFVILVDDGVPEDRAGDMALAMMRLRDKGETDRTAVQQAEHFVELRKSSPPVVVRRNVK